MLSLLPSSHPASTFLPTFPRRGFAVRAFRNSTLLRYYAGSDPCRASPARQLSPVHPLAFRTSHPQPHRVPERHVSLSPPCVRSGLSAPGFAKHEEARRSTPPNRVRVPTGCPFASGCSPPRLGATQILRPSATQLPSATYAVISHGTDSHHADKTDSRTHSCPRLSRASTSLAADEAWMAGTSLDKPGHDVEGAFEQCRPDAPW